MADDLKSKDSSESHGEHHERITPQSDNDSPPSDMPVIAPKMTKKGRFDLVPQPSEDPRDPLNWTQARKWTLFAVMCYATFTTVSAAVANNLATPVQAVDWGVTPEEATYTVSCTLAGIVVGPLFAVPLVMVFGVMSLCFWSCIMVTVSSIWSAVSTGPGGYGPFLGARVYAGLFTSNVQVFTGGVVSQLFFVHERGRAYAIYAAIYLCGQVGGPTFAGYIVNFVEWPVCFWWTVAANGLAAILFFVFGEDTSWDRENQQPITRGEVPKSWLKRRLALFFFGTTCAAPNRKQSVIDSFKAMFLIGLSPVSILLGFYGLAFSGWFVMGGIQLPVILSTPVEAGGFGFSPLGISNFFMASWVGAIVSMAYGALVNDRLPKFLAKRYGVWRVEYRLHTAWLPCMILGPLGCTLFGLSLFYQWHYMVLAVAVVFSTFAAVASLSPQTNYMVEVWRGHSQEVNAVINVYRISFTVGPQFFYQPWVRAVGVEWVWATAALLGLWGFSLVVIVMLFGPKLRQYNLFPETVEEENKIHKQKQLLGRRFETLSDLS